MYPDLALIWEQQRGMFQYDSGDSTLTGQARAVRKNASGLHHQSGHSPDMEAHTETHRRNDNNVMGLEAIPVTQRVEPIGIDNPNPPHRFAGRNGDGLK